MPEWWCEGHIVLARRICLCFRELCDVDMFVKQKCVFQDLVISGGIYLTVFLKVSPKRFVL